MDIGHGGDHQRYARHTIFNHAEQLTCCDYTTVLRLRSSSFCVRTKYCIDNEISRQLFPRETPPMDAQQYLAFPLAVPCPMESHWHSHMSHAVPWTIPCSMESHGQCPGRSSTCMGTAKAEDPWQHPWQSAWRFSSKKSQRNAVMNCHGSRFHVS